MPNINSLLTGHIGQDVEKPAEETGTATEEDQVDDNVKSPKKKKVKKSKAAKDDKPAKCDRSGSSLKQSSFATLQVTTASPAKDYKFERVFYEAGLQLKGEDKYSANVNHIRNLLENIQLVDPLAIMPVSYTHLTLPTKA